MMPKEWKNEAICQTYGRKMYLLDDGWSHGSHCQTQAKKHIAQFIRRYWPGHQAVPK